MSAAQAILKGAGVGRILAGHPWVYAGDIAELKSAPAEGGAVEVFGPRDLFLGTGLYNSRSKIPIRICSRKQGEALDEAFFLARIEAAWALRRRDMGGAGDAVACRVVWSEADFVPGLIIDRYADAWVIQTLTLPMDQRKGMIADLLVKRFGAAWVVERNDVPSRRHEGLDPVKGSLRGSGEARRVVAMGRGRFEVDLLEGQKTGEYLDQITNHVAVGELAKRKRVLDCFTYHGGFAVHAALGGASSVEAIDSSEQAVGTAVRNAELNGVGSIRFKAANVFDELAARAKAEETYDLIILDPPSFTRTRAKMGDALRGYKEIHLRALMMLKPGGLLATFCCSHHVDGETFRAVALDAAFDARRILRLGRTFSQSADHPVIPAIPETEYLKGFLFEVVG